MFVWDQQFHVAFSHSEKFRMIQNDSDSFGNTDSLGIPQALLIQKKPEKSETFRKIRMIQNHSESFRDTDFTQIQRRSHRVFWIQKNSENQKKSE